MTELTSITTTDEYPQHSVLASVGLHIIPGILVTAVFIILKPLVEGIGYPPLLAFILAVLLVDIPFQLGVMYNRGKKLNGRYSLQGIVLYREKTPWGQFLIIFLVGIVLLFGLFTLAMPVNSFLSQQLFSWLPDWIFLNDAAQYEAYPQSTLLITLTLFLIVTGIALPWVEELYFRGFLMPRISRFKAWAPIAVDAYIENMMAEHKIPGLALSIVHDDEIVYTQGYGVTGPDGAPVTPQTPFIIGSSSKIIHCLGYYAAC